MYTEIYSIISILSKKTEKSGQEKLAIRTLFKQWRCSNPCCLFEPFCLREYVKLGFCYLGCLHLGFSPKSKWDNKNKTWYKPSSPFLNFLQRDNMQHFPRLYWNLLPFATNFMKKKIQFLIFSENTTWFKPSSLFLNFLKKDIMVLSNKYSDGVGINQIRSSYLIITKFSTISFKHIVHYYYYRLRIQYSSNQEINFLIFSR